MMRIMSWVVGWRCGREEAHGALSERSGDSRRHCGEDWWIC